MQSNSLAETVRSWVNTLTAVPRSVVDKLIKDPDSTDIFEVTPPALHNSVHILDGEHAGEEGTIVSSPDAPDCYSVSLDSTREVILLNRSSIHVIQWSHLPAWGTMWAFPSPEYNRWLERRENRQKMADCGFRIYRSDDYEFLFGNDSGGYDFFERHWIPLYQVMFPLASQSTHPESIAASR